jgi:signal transduction histidine kinase
LEKIRVLAIDDDPGDLELLHRFFLDIAAWEVDFHGHFDWRRGERELERQSIDVLLIDYALGSTTGLDVIKEVRQAGNDTPIIMLTGQGDERIAADVIRAGADDYLVKRDITPDMLRRAVANAVAQFRLRREKAIIAENLRQSQKMEAIGTLTSGVAHEFNNILAAIIGYAEIIHLRMEAESPLRYFIEQIQVSADRASDLTNGLLAFSRNQALNVKPIDLCGVVQGFKKMLERLLPADIDFRTTIAEGNLIVMADKSRIEQVLMNLVTNAKDAMSRGGTLSIDVAPAVMDETFVHMHDFGEPGNYARISVTDTGEGMNEETRKRIFEPFFTTKEVGKGTGLGMAIVYGIIQQHNGSIAVNSEKGRGTTFSIYLPLCSEGTTEAHGVRVVEAPPGGTETILLAEDEVTVRKLYKMILEKAGYRVVEAVDGQDALDKFIEHMAEVDIVATEVIMPKIDGKSLYEEIRKIRPDMKVLFMSGYAKDTILERGILDDEFCYVTKPIKSFDLLKKVREVLDRD